MSRERKDKKKLFLKSSVASKRSRDADTRTGMKRKAATCVSLYVCMVEGTILWRCCLFSKGCVVFEMRENQKVRSRETEETVDQLNTFRDCKWNAAARDFQTEEED